MKRMFQCMNIRGIYKTSFLDYPGKICAVLFSGGCNLRCRFCHNPDLACNSQDLDSFSNEEALAFLKKRQHLIDGVTISGGEPTLAENLEDFLGDLRDLDLLVKLDTNGFRPERVKTLLADELVDYVALDIKTSPEKYDTVAGCSVSFDDVATTVEYLKSAKAEYELRTTCVPGYVTADDFRAIGTVLGRVSSYYLQQYVASVPLLDPSWEEITPYSIDKLYEFQHIVSTFSDRCQIRGI